MIAGDAAGGAEGPAIVAHENVLLRMSAKTDGKPAAPFRAWPSETYHSEEKRLSPHFHGDEAIQIFHAPEAHSDGDSIVYFRRADVIMTGELFSTTAYPVIDIGAGGTVGGVIAGLNHVLQLAFSDFRSEGGTMIVPGHGRLCDLADVAYYRDMVAIIRDRIQAMARKGMTLEQILAMKPTMDYDPLYGSAAGPWTTAQFVEAVYKTLGSKDASGRGH